MTIELRHLHLLSLIEVVEATELKTNNMARVNGSGFKMKSSSPVKGLSNFFSSLGSQLKEGQKERGIFSEAGKAEKKSRKPGESKFKADVRRGKERRAKEKAAKVQEPYDIKSSSVFEPTKFGHEGKSFFGPTTSDLDRRLMMGDEKKLNLKSDVFDLSARKEEATKLEKITEKDKRPSGTSDSYMRKHKTGKYAKSIVTPSDDSTGEGFTVYNPGRKREAGKKSFGIRPPATLTFSTKEEADAYITENKGSFLKRSGFKMKNSPARNYKKGYYGVK